MIGIIKRLYWVIVVSYMIMGLFVGINGFINPSINTDAGLVVFNSLITLPLGAFLFYKLVGYIVTGKIN